jgi:trigger factor
MKVTQEKLPASQIKLEIEVSPEMSKQAYEKKLQEFTRKVNIPGFRKGKVPRQVLIQQFGSIRIKTAVVEELVESSLKQALEQEKVETISNFQLKSSFEDLVNQYEPGSTLTFSVAADVPPEVNLKQYKGLYVQAEETQYNPAKVDEMLENYRNRAATLVPIEGRTAQEKDVATVDFAGRFLPEEGAEEIEANQIPGGNAQDFEIELLEERLIPGFVKGIIGMTPGEIKEISVNFPEDYVQQDLAGKPAVFTVTLKELKEKELPPLDDDFAQDVSEFETLVELQESLEKRFREEAAQRTRANQDRALLNELVKQVEVELPETLIKQESNYMVTQTAMQLSEHGIDVNQAFSDAKLVAQLQERARPEAIVRLQGTLALSKIAELEGITVEPEAIDARLNEVMKNYSSKEVDSQQLRQVIAEELLKQKIFDWLLENSTVELVPEGSLSTAESTLQEELAALERAEFVQTEVVPEVVSEVAEAVIEVIAAPEQEPLDVAAQVEAKTSASILSSVDIAEAQAKAIVPEVFPESVEVPEVPDVTPEMANETGEPPIEIPNVATVSTKLSEEASENVDEPASKGSITKKKASKAEGDDEEATNVISESAVED